MEEFTVSIQSLLDLAEGHPNFGIAIMAIVGTIIGFAVYEYILKRFNSIQQLSTMKNDSEINVISTLNEQYEKLNVMYNAALAKADTDRNALFLCNINLLNTLKELSHQETKNAKYLAEIERLEKILDSNNIEYIKEIRNEPTNE